MKRKLWAVVCGSIRDELDFKLTLSKLIQLRKKKKIDHIVLSTWFKEVDKYEGLRELLISLDIFVIENSTLSNEFEKTPSGSVNYWRQARQLLLALDFIPKNDFVLRVRTDRSLNFINLMEQQGIFDNYQNKVNDIGKFTKVFEYKIIVFRPRITRLFQMTDFILLGLNRDLYKVINFGIYDLEFQKVIVANAQWYAQPFIKEFPILRDYMRFTMYTQSVPLFKRYVEKYKNESYFAKVHLKVYAIYFLVLYSHFKILSFEKFDPSKREKFNFYEIFCGTKNGSIKYQSLGTIIVDEKIIEMALFNQFEPSKSYSQFLKYVNNLIAFGPKDPQFDLNFEDYNELVVLFNNKTYENNEKEGWLKKLYKPPVNTNILSKEPSYSNELELNCLGVDFKDWSLLSDTKLIESDLFKLWNKIENPSVKTAEMMLLPVARTGNEYAIYVLLDLLFLNKVSSNNIDEIFRISNFYLDIRFKNKTPHIRTTLLILKFLKIVIQRNDIFSLEKRFLDFGLSLIIDEKIRLAILNEYSSDILPKIKNEVLKLKSEKNNFEYDLILSSIFDYELSLEIQEFLEKSKRMNELMMVKRKWLN
ncbi:hypothetical protein [Acinetobacter rudis]|uniref:Uncharacterized protein n=1 Tax=Acinetobacter rudis TaxID=632955 RepID=A0AAW8JGZ3_9GAMM|nr:hypothetical protein [Acinetobacter rudis]MDQ8936984.1 hypothetical protein [Acinetobacter rudis]MDQ9016574.1 hypothetical protein [Acinetobacter rudis]